MSSNEVKIFVKQLLNDGVSLSDIQKKLQNELDVKMTFLDLRLLASELEEVDWSKQKSDIEAQQAAEKSEKEKAEKDKNSKAEEGKTVVEVSKLKRPGALANGSVKFASGAKAEWILDQTGRLGLDKQEGEPTQEDLQEFQMELQNILANGGI